MPIDWNVTVLAALGIGLIVGVGLGVLLRGRSAAADRARAEQLETDLGHTREELETHREEVARHFQSTSELFRDLTEQYSRLYTHLADGARAFSTETVPALGALETPLLVGQADPKPAEVQAASDPERAGTPDGAASEAPGSTAPAVQTGAAAADRDALDREELEAADADGGFQRESRVAVEPAPSVKPNGGLGPPPLAPPPA